MKEDHYLTYVAVKASSLKFEKVIFSSINNYCFWWNLLAISLYYKTIVILQGAGHVAQTFKPKEVYNMIKRWFSFSLI